MKDINLYEHTCNVHCRCNMLGDRIINADSRLIFKRGSIGQ